MSALYYGGSLVCRLRTAIVALCYGGCALWRLRSTLYYADSVVGNCVRSALLRLSSLYDENRVRFAIRAPVGALRISSSSVAAFVTAHRGHRHSRR